MADNPPPPADDDEYWEGSEPVGCCINCDGNIYANEDDGSGLCEHCQWYAPAGGNTHDV